MKKLIPRTIFGLIYALLIYFCTTLNPYACIALLAIFAGLCWWEFKKITQFKDWFYLLASAIVGLFVLFYFSRDFLTNNSIMDMGTLKYTPSILFSLAIVTIFFSTQELLSDFAKATISVVYIVTPFAIALSIPKSIYLLGKEQLTQELFFIFVLIWISDSFAYLVGSIFGKHTMAPKISPKKSWEGLIGGILFTILLAYCFQIYFATDFNLTQYNWLHIGLIIAIFAPLGDLAESKLKRFFQVKDSANTIPGHGGFLDRLDSFLVCIPAVYTYLLFV